jgi:hypothetical protein
MRVDHEDAGKEINNDASEKEIWALERSCKTLRAPNCISEEDEIDLVPWRIAETKPFNPDEEGDDNDDDESDNPALRAELSDESELESVPEK